MNKIKMSVQLNYKIEGEGHTIVLIHGLFGNLDNLGLLARDLKVDHQVLSIDLRNHGQSFHSDTHNYQAMAQDVAQLLKDLELNDVTVIGHSMGGKVAMALTQHLELRKLIVLDMAPVAYIAKPPRQRIRRPTSSNGRKASHLVPKLSKYSPSISK